MHDFKAPPHLWPRIAVRTVGCCVETFCCGTGGHEGWQWLWRWDGAAAGGEPQSDARSLENMAMASGKLGGVAGVFLGNCRGDGKERRYMNEILNRGQRLSRRGMSSFLFLQCKRVLL